MEQPNVFHNDVSIYPQDQPPQETIGGVIESGSVSTYRVAALELHIVTQFYVLLGEVIPKVGDMIKHWEGDMIGETTDFTAILPDNTKAIKITKIKKIEPLTTGGYNPEGIIMTIEGDLILNS